MIKKYRKKPVVIEAMKVTTDLSWDDLTGFCPSLTVRPDALRYDTPVTVIETLEGDMAVQYGDYIIKGIQGEFYPCKPDIFKQTYEEVE